MKKEKVRRIAKRITALAAAVAMAATFTFPAEVGNGLFDGFGNAIVASAVTSYTGEELDISNGSIVINSDSEFTYGGQPYMYPTGDEIIVTGTSSDNYISVNSGSVTKITLKNASIGGSLASNVAAVSITSGSTANITLVGSNTLTGGYNAPGLFVAKDNTVSFTAASTGSLTASGNNQAPGIGASATAEGGHIIVNGGDITVKAGGYTATNALGSAFAGCNKPAQSFTMTGGKVCAVPTKGFSSGYFGDNVSTTAVTVSGDIIISGGIFISQFENLQSHGTGIGGKLITTDSGNAIIWTKFGCYMGSAISDTSNRAEWHGIIIEGYTDAKVYGSYVTLPGDFTIETDVDEFGDDVVLEVPEGSTLVIPSGVTLTNNNIIKNNGTIIIDGTLANFGTINNFGMIVNNNAVTGSGKIYNENGGTTSGSGTYTTAPVTIGTDFLITPTNSSDTLVYGTDYTYEGGVLTIKSDKAITIKNANTGSTTDTIVVEKDKDANITLAGVDIDVSGTGNSNTGTTGSAAFLIADGSTGDVTITLADGTTNKLKSGVNCAGLQKNGDTSTGMLTITGNGSLEAGHGDLSAGIGGGNEKSTSNITISGGNITANGDYAAAGIGGGYSGSGTNITISDGIVKATGGNSGAGIGGACGAEGNSITISGGIVTATASGYYGAGIGGGNNADGKIIKITGGSVKAQNGIDGNAIGGGAGKAAVTPTNGTDNVYLLTIENPNSDAVTINGTPYTPVNHKALDSNDSNLYAYLPAKSLSTPNEVNVGSTTTYWYYDTTNSKWINVIDDVTINIDKPTAGDTLATSAAVISPSTGVEAITSSDIVWKDASDSEVSGTAGYNKEYTVYVTLNASSGYAFKTGVGATVNTNGTATVTENNGGTITVKYKFGNTDAETEIDSVDIVIDEPTAGSALAANASVSTTGVKTTAPTISWTGEKDTNGKAKYNTVYTASVTLEPDTGYVFGSSVTANIKTSASGTAVGTGTVTPNATDGTITVEYAFTTAKAKLISITDPTAITGVANGTTKTAAALGMPSTVTIETEDTSVTSASVSWDVSSASYDPSVLTEQTFSVSGTVTLPTDIDDNNISLDVTISVTVSAADTTAAPTASPIGGTYTDNQSVVLSCTTQGAVIYYTTDGTIPTTSSTQYTAPISVTGTAGQSVTTTIKAIAVKDGMQNSSVAAFNYTIEIPAEKYLVTVNNGALVILEINLGNSKYAQGETVTIMADTPEIGKQFKEWIVISGNVTFADSTSSITSFEMPASAVEVTATYEDIPAVTHTITATAGENGSISPNGDVSVEEGSDKTFIITPDSGYEIDTLTVDGSAVTAATSYIFENVTDDHTISVTFKQSHTHSYGTKWKNDSTSHWHECECGDKTNIEAHTEDSGTVTTEPTETTEGVKTYKCVKCEYVMRTETIPPITPEHTHEYGTEWKSDSTSHWHECACGEKADIAAHISDNGVVTLQPTETSEGIMTYSCSVCDYILRTETIPAIVPEHTHEYGTEWKSDSSSHWHECSCGDKADIGQHISDNGVVTLQPTETSEGIMTYSCSVCDYILRTETIPPITPEHTHEYGTEWKSDSTSHWHECSCGEKADIGQHISNGGVVTVQPTATSTGVRTYSCRVCGYVLRRETIPATGYNNYPYYPTYPTYPFDSSIFNVVSFTETLNVTAETTGNSVTLKWDKVEKADKYYVYQYKNGKYVKIKTTTDTSVTLKGLKNGETYKFLVRYTINGRLSPIAKSSKFTVKVYYKPIPKATADKNSIKLTWDAVPEAEKYAIYKYVDGKAVKLAEIKGTSVKINKLIPDTEYKYIVRAYVDGKWTTMLKSDIVTVKTKAE